MEEAGDLPLYYTEWNSSPSPRDRYHDTSYCASFIVKNLMDNLGLIDCYSFWTFTDIFEECGLSSRPFHGGFGMLNIHGIPKPSYRAFQLMQCLDGERIEAAAIQDAPLVDFAASKNDSSITVLLSNFNVLNAPIEAEYITITFPGLKNAKSAYLMRIDDAHANPKKAWVEMGSPTYLNQKQIDELTKVSELVKEDVVLKETAEGTEIALTIEPLSAVMVSIEI